MKYKLPIAGSISSVTVISIVLLLTLTGQCDYTPFCDNFVSIPESGYDQGISESMQIQRVLDYCHTKDLMKSKKLESKNGTIFVLDAIGYHYFNETHYIDNNVCEWQLLENYPNSDNLCIPGQHIENNKHRIRNSTHIYDNESCMWKELEICKGHCGIENEN